MTVGMGAADVVGGAWTEVTGAAAAEEGKTALLTEAAAELFPTTTLLLGVGAPEDW